MPHKDPEKRRAYGTAYSRLRRSRMTREQKRAEYLEEKNRRGEEINAYRREHRRKNVDLHRAKARVWKQANPSRCRDWSLRAKFGIGVEDYNRMHAEQKGVCAICGRPETSTCRGRVRSLAVDHCHQTGHIRGLLCRACNTAMGHLGDDATLLQAAVDYLRRHQDKKCPSVVLTA